jgi:hypothetical protein
MRYHLFMPKLPIRYLSEKWPSLYLKITAVIIRPTHHILLLIPCCTANRFTTPNQQNAQNCSYILTFYHTDIATCFYRQMTIIRELNKLIQLYTKVADLVVCCITFILFPDEGPLRTETCRSVKCDIIM